MNPLTNYAEVFNKNDSKLFAELFADDCIFYDTAPTCAGMDPISGQCYTAEMGTRELKEIAMKNSNHSYLLIDDSKLHVKGFCTFAQLDEFEDVFINRTTGMETLPDHFIAVK